MTKTDYYRIRRAAIKKSTGEKENACARGSDQTKDRDIKAQSLYAYICDTNYNSRLICMKKNTRWKYPPSPREYQLPSWSSDISDSRSRKQVFRSTALKSLNMISAHYCIPVKPNKGSRRRQRWLWMRHWSSFWDRMLLQLNFKLGDRRSWRSFTEEIHSWI